MFAPPLHIPPTGHLLQRSPASKLYVPLAQTLHVLLLIKASPIVQFLSSIIILTEEVLKPDNVKSPFISKDV